MPKRNHERSPDKKNFSIALPKTLINDIQRIADEEDRTRNRQIERFLTESVKDWKAKHSEDPTIPSLMAAEDQNPTRQVPSASSGITYPAAKKPRLRSLKNPPSDERKAN